ncbi:hypothetical protein VF14_35050 [Nostoc linckia z18]|uniref:Uncharacterized protein n=2 Tax=Nostoc linckia TaxID=92942 RepID=A0A9Q5Z4N5_NOSLI|nr:hypothetical protein [Nostoc linckia]PHJ93045.1 hypothetical protein VF08_36015 [Nostoc linckia z8]PHK13929.1 hypothetical protein VF10_32290 [Nostoc linckia z13]PHK28113.1 hypothetical protein VF14_35050 [Nostoc linckia z18]PHJ56382.1 hypothetical protein VF05_37350 [Nostoc linckia z3]PHJ56736.1 hypothetical protein VF03_37255 [Nostoc linckia z2]
MIHPSNLFTLSDYVRLVGHLPYTPPVLFDSKGEEEIFRAKRVKYMGASYWLKNILLGEWLPKDENWYLFQDLKLTAKQLATYFHLATEVYNNTLNEEILQLRSPASLWFRVCVSASEIDLRTSGVLGKPALKGKKQTLKGVTEVYSQLQSLSFKAREYPTINCPTTLLLFEAQEIARQDTRFYKNQLIPFIRQMRKHQRTIERNSSYQRYYLLPNDEILFTEKDVKLSSYKP